MAINFPVFYGGYNEDAKGFLDNLEMAHLISGRDTNEIKLRAFPLELKSEARTWYDGLPGETKGDWDVLTRAFATRFDTGFRHSFWEGRYPRGSMEVTPLTQARGSFRFSSV